MKRASLAAALAASFSVWTSSALAVPTVAPFVDTPPCDAHVITLTHELGNIPPFPLDEAIASTSTIAQFQGCSTFPAGLLIPDWEVAITNLTTTSWVDLFFVADADKVFGNVDGMILGGLAFKIDTVGVNTPLLSESITANLIFEPGETWLFYVLDWDPVANGGPPSMMDSIGVGVGSIGTPPSTASIVARPLQVPEPGALVLLAGGLGALSLARRFRPVRR